MSLGFLFDRIARISLLICLATLECQMVRLMVYMTINSPDDTRTWFDWDLIQLIQRIEGGKKSDFPSKLPFITDVMT